MDTLDLRDFWLGDVTVTGKPDPARVKHLVELLHGRHIHTVPAVVVLVGKRGKLTAEGEYAADRVAALREAFAGTLERLDRLEQLGRVRVVGLVAKEGLR